MGESVEGLFSIGVTDRVGLVRGPLAVTVPLLALLLFIFLLLLHARLLGLLLKFAVDLVEGLSLLDVLQDDVVALQLESGWQPHVQQSRLVGVRFDAYVVVFVLTSLERRQTELVDWLLTLDLS